MDFKKALQQQAQQQAAAQAKIDSALVPSSGFTQSQLTLSPVYKYTLYAASFVLGLMVIRKYVLKKK